MDHAIADRLPAEGARSAVRVGRQVWTAEIAGTGRGRWPAYFTGPPARSVYGHFRIQAAVAEHGASPSQAVVHLVWAGADPSGAMVDDRTATVHLRKDGDTWAPIAETSR